MMESARFCEISYLDTLLYYYRLAIAHQEVIHIVLFTTLRTPGLGGFLLPHSSIFILDAAQDIGVTTPISILTFYCWTPKILQTLEVVEVVVITYLAEKLSVDEVNVIKWILLYSAKKRGNY